MASEDTRERTPDRSQASEVHDTTADASRSPTAAEDEQTTRDRTGHGQSPSSPKKVNPDAGDSRIVSDESDDGGPVRVEL